MNTTAAKIREWVPIALLVILLPLAFVATTKISQQGPVLDRIDKVLAADAARNESTACSRDINAALTAAQADAVSVNLEALAVTLTGLLEASETGDLSPEFIARALETLPVIPETQVALEAAKADALNVNELCPLPS